MKNSLRLLFRVGWPAWLLIAAASCALVFANMRPTHRLLGHISSSEPRLRPGVFIQGHDHGWPWVFRTESFKTELVPEGHFERFEWLALFGNVAVGIAALATVAICAERVRKRLGRTPNKAARLAAT